MGQAPGGTEEAAEKMGFIFPIPILHPVYLPGVSHKSSESVVTTASGKEYTL
jgi:hypothetical protein